MGGTQRGAHLVEVSCAGGGCTTPELSARSRPGTSRYRGHEWLGVRCASYKKVGTVEYVICFIPEWIRGEAFFVCPENLKGA